MQSVTKTNEKKTYIHYGNDHFDMGIFREKARLQRDNSFLNKPPFGFWASPIGSHYFTWKDWCECENYRTDTFDKSFIFTLKEDARILTVRRNADIIPYLKDSGWLGTKVLDFNILMTEFDGIELIHGTNYEQLHLLPGYFNSWDVDSIVVWNPYIIVPVNKNKEVA